MNKFMKFATVGALALSFAGTAFAASSISNIRFDNGQTQKDCTAGQSVNVTFRVTVPAGEVAELGQVDVLGDNLAPALPVQLGGDLGLQEGANDVSTSVTCPQNTGYYTVEYRTAGIFGGQRAINITDGVVSLNSFSNAVRVVSSTSTGGTGTSEPSWLDNFLATLIAALKPTPAPVATACSTLTAKLVGTQMNTVNDANVKLQGFLLSEGQSIPALAAGASFGFYGSQTQAAVSSFKLANLCN